MGIRPAKAIRDINKVAWTRYSKSKPRKSYIKAMPHQDLQQFRMGIQKEDYDVILNLECQEDVILRDNTIESARQSANKLLEKNIPTGYYFIVRIFPHHVIRENKMIAGAGADRLQKGMRQSFGRPTDKAARVYSGKALFTVYTYKQYEQLIRQSLERAKRKLSGRFKIIEAKKGKAA
ncbi:50S ribosomal protein L16 [Candidatus Micrarchaeota archaeon]|nr:50S ribosomal protein L16 [Candidatus Micrarchaeota archaeon]